MLHFALCYRFSIMLKWLAIFTVILGLAVFVAREDKRASDDAARKAAGQNNTTLAAKPDALHPQENRSNPDGDDPSWYGFFRWPNGTTAWAIILTLFVIAEQSKQTARAAKATEDSLVEIKAQASHMGSQTEILRNSVAVAQRSADAAFLNAQAIINSERPWIFAFTKKEFLPAADYFSVHIRNKGRTPAFVLEGSIGLLIVKDFNDLPNVPPYNYDTLVRGRILLPRAKALVFGISRKALKKRFGNAFPQFPEDGKILIIGRFEYRDLLNPDPKITHETRWICWYQPSETGDEIRPVEGIGLPVEYERYT